MNNLHPTRRTALALGAAALLAVVLSGCLSSDQTQDMTLINQARRDNKASQLTASNTAMTKAQGWSDHMARTGVLEHTGGGTTVNPAPLTHWCKYAENVGKGS